METVIRQQLEQVLLKHVAWFSSELATFIVETNLKGKLRSHCWSNELGVIVGYVSYSPHNDPQEESIELCLTPSFNSERQKIDLFIDIYWSDGSAIQDLIDHKDIELENAVLQIDLTIEQSKFKLLTEMKKEISIDRPSRYRKD